MNISLAKEEIENCEIIVMEQAGSYPSCYMVFFQEKLDDGTIKITDVFAQFEVAAIYRTYVRDTLCTTIQIQSQSHDIVLYKKFDEEMSDELQLFLDKMYALEKKVIE